LLVIAQTKARGLRLIEAGIAKVHA
jgi:hypothetical protein